MADSNLSRGARRIFLTSYFEITTDLLEVAKKCVERSHILFAQSPCKLTPGTEIVHCQHQEDDIGTTY